MTQVHATAGTILIGLLVCFTLTCLLFTKFLSPPSWLESAAKAVIALVAVQIGIGAASFLTGARPAEPLHFLYAAAALGAIPAARSFSSEAPPRARAGVLAVGGALTAMLLWRLTETG